MGKCVITNPVGRVFPIHVDREDMFFKWEIEEYITREREYIKGNESDPIAYHARIDMLDRMKSYFLPED